MSNSRLLNSERAEGTTATIGFRFHANDEELEEVQLDQESFDVKNPDENIQLKIGMSTPEILEGAISECVKEQRNLLGKRSISVDSAYESPFTNPIETWKKLNVLKEKITKTVEEKILEMKIDKNVLSKSSRSRLSHSKENSSISDSEDTSESSKVSEQGKNVENQTSTFDKQSNNNTESQTDVLDTNAQDAKNVKPEIENNESENDLRNRKISKNLSELMNVPDIKIATAKVDADGGSLMDESFSDEVESGVEADENFDAEDDSLDLDVETIIGRGGSNNPPFGGNIFRNVLIYLNSWIVFQKSTIIIILGFTLYFFLPLSEFVRGFLLSFLLIMFWETVKSYVHINESPLQQRPFVLPCYDSMPPLKVPPTKPVKGIWFNEYEMEKYDPDYYSVSQTVPAYLELEDNILKISRPKGKIHRRATYDEPEYNLPIISQRTYNISGCNIYLMPDGLTRKRLFSKKYPIVIFLKPNSLISEKKNEKEFHENVETDDEPCVINSESPKNRCTLYLFARCDRQKEEWYRKLLAAAKHRQKFEKVPEPAENTEGETEKPSSDDSPSKDDDTPYENLSFDDGDTVEEYISYMENFVQEIFCQETISRCSSSEKSKTRTEKVTEDSRNPKENASHLNHKNSPMDRGPKKSKGNSRSKHVEESGEKESKGLNYSTNKIMWFNAFVNRILFDVFRSPYWHRKIQEKVYKKLNSIRLPYYIEDIEVIEFDMGKAGPMFHRASQPYIDDRGLWFDMDLTFDGLIRLTIQTHLNLIKLQSGVEKVEETPQNTDKPKKGKKKEKTEKECVSSKESGKEKPPEPDKRNSKQLPKSSASSPPEEETKRQNSQNSNLESGAVLSNTLVDEVARFAEIAIAESLEKTVGEKKETKPVDGSATEPSKDRSAIYDSEMEDSAESSEEEDDMVETFQPPPPEEPRVETLPRRYPKNRRSSKKIFKVFENVAQSKYFKSMAQSKYIQKAIAGVSAAKLRLTLEVKSCTGVLSINVPPPPSDRFWCGFRHMPELVFSANPKIGDKPLRFVHIRNYLQKKILHELKGKMVQPNMITVICPMLAREELPPKFFNVPVFPNNLVMVLPNMIDFVLPTSGPARSSSFLQIEESDLQDPTEPE